MSAAAAPPDLLALRAELDRIDDALHDLLMRRADIVTQVGALRAKGPVALRPGREAAILTRLLARNQGALDPATLVRVWRDILNGSTAQQQSLKIAVAAPALIPLIRQHFGTQARIEILSTDEDAIAAIHTGATQVAVLRWPAPWWPTLPQQQVHIVAKLPFWGPSGETAPPTAMVLTAAEPDPSGHDRTLIATGPTLQERDGFLTPADLPPGATIVGAYAIPLGTEP